MTRRLSCISFLSACAVSAALALLPARQASGFAYVFAGEANGIDLVAHAMGYTGTGGNLAISVGIDPGSTHAADMIIPTANAVNTWNGMTATTGNLQPGAISGHDYESVLLHELGHALGLAHPNLASESGVSGSAQNATRTTDGLDNVFTLNSGVDGIFGSADDIRGDDVNLNYFQMSDNNPFDPGFGTVDSTTYSRDIADLPGGDNFSANADRAVAAALGFVNTEAVMQQGSVFGEIQRTLGADDVAGMLYARTRLDEVAGTSDDYTVTLDFLGLNAGADIVIDFDNSVTYAATYLSGSFIGASGHAVVTSGDISFNTGHNWYFNQESNAAEVSAPGVFTLFGTGLLVIAAIRCERKTV